MDGLVNIKIYSQIFFNKLFKFSNIKFIDKFI